MNDELDLCGQNWSFENSLGFHSFISSSSNCDSLRKYIFSRSLQLVWYNSFGTLFYLYTLHSFFNENKSYQTNSAINLEKIRTLIQGSTWNISPIDLVSMIELYMRKCAVVIYAATWAKFKRKPE